MSSITMLVNDHVAEITLGRAPLNILDVPFLEDLLAALRRAAADDQIRAVIVASGLPNVFSAGIDLNGVLAADGLAVHHLLEKLYIELADVQHSLGKPSIAAISGAARGGGMTLAIQCNVILAAKTATFGYPEVDVGLLPAIHFIHLPRIIGRHRAFDLLFSGRSFSADEAAQLGLVSRVVDAAKLLDEARALARTFAAKPAVAMRLGHAAFMRFNDYRPEIGHTTEAFCTVAATDDARSAIRAFLDRRPKP
jgi:enoyl-CoA hydratase